MPEIDDYGFGWIMVDGERYENDLIIFQDHIASNWWRDDGHTLKPDDLDAVIDRAPSKLIVGTGYNGRMTVTDRTEQFLDDHGIDIAVYKTRTAWTRFNELNGDVAAALHLTC